MSEQNMDQWSRANVDRYLHRDFELVISSPVHYEKLCVEINHRNRYVGMISQEEGAGHYILELPDSEADSTTPVPDLKIPLKELKSAEGTAG